MSSKYLSSMEIDAIGEIQNISLGASATAVSTMLNARTNITTPTVSVVTRDEFEFGSLDPAVCVEITYIEGLTGKNIMILKREDVKIIVEMLMGIEIPDEEFELSEINISAICEVMNQMMGASSTALSELLSKTINISTPTSFGVDDINSFKDLYFENNDPMVCIRFHLSIDEKMASEFMNLMPISLAKELVSGFFPDGLGDEDIVAEPEEPVAIVEEPAAAPVEPVTQPAPAASSEPSGSVMSQDEINKLLGNMSEEPAAAPVEPVTQPAPAVSSEPSGSVMSQDEINKLLGNMSEESAAAPVEPVTQSAPAASSEPSGSVMSQDEINKLLGNMSEEPAAAPKPAAAPVEPVTQSAPAASSEPSGSVMSQDEINKLLGNMSEEPAAVPKPTAAPVEPVTQSAPAELNGAAAQPQIIMQQAPANDMLKQMMNMMQQQMEMQQQQIAQLQKQISDVPKGIKVNQPPRPNLQADNGEYDPDANVDLIMGVALDVSVEIGRTKKLVKDILELNRGSLVVLDKLAGEQVDVFVNGECIAKGDVVVVEDNFGVRITEILKEEIDI